jgi:hypothetical protein
MTAKYKHVVVAFALRGLIIIFQLSTVFGQGALTPPGPPGATMKTLLQIEPRTPISSAPFLITQPGSYYVTTNLTVSTGNAISISTNGVTLDLGGFTLSSTELSGPAASGISFIGVLQNITIFNGFIRSGVTNNGSGVYSGAGFVYGIYSGNQPANVLVSRVSVSGCVAGGIVLGESDSTTVEDCTARTIGGYGLRALTIRDSSAIDCGGNAIEGLEVMNCYAASTGANGIVAENALNCYGNASSSSSGVYALTAESAENCTGYSTGTSATGLYADESALNCIGVCGNGGYAIDCGGSAQNCNGYCIGTGYAISTGNAENCYGYTSGGGYGLYASSIAIGSYGYCYSGTGLFAFIGSVCHGATTTGTLTNLTHNVNSF